MTRIERLRRDLFISFTLTAIAAVLVAVPIVLYPYDRHPLLNSVAVFAAGADRFVVGSPVTIASAPRITIDRGTISLARSADAPPKDRKSIARVLGAGRSAIAIEDAVLRVNLHHDPQDTAALKQSLAQYDVAEDSAFLIPIVKAIVRQGFSSLVLRRCTVLIEIPGTSPYRLENADIDVRIDSGSKIELTGSIQYRGQSLDVTTEVGLTGLNVDSERFPIRATAKNEHLHAKLNGDISFGPRSRISAKSANLKLESLGDTARWLGLAWPRSGPSDNFEANGFMDWSPGLVGFHSATFTLGGNKATGALSLVYRESRAMIEGTLAARSLDLTPYVENQEHPTALSLIQSSLWLDRLNIGARSETIRFIRALDADIRVSSDSVKVSKFRSEHAATTINVRDGILLADIAETQLVDGGSGEVQISFDASGVTPKTGIRGRVSGSGLSKVLEWAFGLPVISGNGSLVVAVSGEGLSRYEFLNSLNGTVDAQIPGSANVAIDLKSLIDDQFEGGVVPRWGQSSSSNSKLENVTAALVFKNGHAKIRNLRGGFGKSLLVVSGEIEFPAKAVDLTLSISGRTVGKNPSAGREVWHATGNWSKPNVMSLDRAEQTLMPIKNDIERFWRQKVRRETPL